MADDAWIPVLVCRRTAHGDRPADDDILDVPCARCGALVWIEAYGTNFPEDMRGLGVVPVCQECLPPDAVPA